jgi:hypothetical protein
LTLYIIYKVKNKFKTHILMAEPKTPKTPTSATIKTPPSLHLPTEEETSINISALSLEPSSPRQMTSAELGALQQTDLI